MPFRFDKVMKEEIQQRAEGKESKVVGTFQALTASYNAHSTLQVQGVKLNYHLPAPPQ
jgi:hypothetical protein